MPERDGSGTTTSTWGGTTTEDNDKKKLAAADLLLGGGIRDDTAPGSNEAERGVNGEGTSSSWGFDAESGKLNGEQATRRKEIKGVQVTRPGELPINPLCLHLRSQPGRGNGVFTSVVIPAGTLIEESPVLLVSAEQWERGDMQKTIFGEYGFSWSGGGQAIGLGLASLFNHSAQPNVNFLRQPHSSTIRFVAARTIQPDEELCICYSADESKLWFTPTGSGIDASTPIPASPPPVNNFPTFDSDDLLDSDEIAAKEARIKRRLERKEEIRLSEEGKPKGIPRHPRLGRSTGSSEEMEYLGRDGSRPPSRSDAESLSSGSSSSYPVYPALPDRRPLDMPPPLHSGPSRVTSTIPAVLCPDLDWREEDWVVKKGEPPRALPGWTEVIRVKGPAEVEEDAEDDGLLDVWVVSVDDPKHTRLVLDFAKVHCPIDNRMRHLKRVARRKHPHSGKETTLIALCATYDSTQSALQSALSAYHPSLLDVQPFLHSVPASPAKSPAELETKSPIWPVAYAAGTLKISDSSSWTPARKAWVYACVQRVIAVARDAKAKGEIPVGTFVASPPECFWPQNDAFIPPTPFLRACACDTRISAVHPLKHAALNCIRQIAALRTQPPFSEMQPTRNGADYLLTSLTLFITHEPCVMCCMALLHSRVREVFYIIPRKKAGGFESAFGVHGRKDLNHRFEVWKYVGGEGEVAAWEEELRIPDDVAL